MKTVDEALAKSFGLNAKEYAKVLEIMGRTPSFTELGIFSVMWSEHCSYKSSRIWLKATPDQSPLGHPRPRRECRRHRYRRWAGRDFQDGIA